jgi:hypothetical protein
MMELYTAECRRFGRWAIGLGVLHAAALFFLDRTFPGMRDDEEIAVLAGFAYAVTGAIFGFYQSASYARVNHWIALLHRPLPPWRIMAGVTGAAATLAFAAVLLPLLAFTAALTLQVGRVVDARHWPMALAGALFALIGFGIGSYLALAPRRYGWAALAAAGVLTISSLGTGTGALLLPLLVIAVLTALVMSAFKPDRSLPPSHPALLALTASVAALSLYFLLLAGGGLAYQLGLAAIGRNPLVNIAPPGGLVEASRAESDDLLAAALASSSSPEAAVVRARLRGVEALRLPIGYDEVPTRGDLTNIRPITFTGPRRSVDWTYSHDTNSFLGLRLKDRRPIGEFRPVGGFEAPPILLGDGSMIAGGSLYRLDPRSSALERRLHLPGEMILAKPVPIGPVAALLSDRALHFVGPDGAGASGATIAVPLPGLVGDLRRIDLARLPDRIVVSFFFGRDSVEGPSRAWQRVVSVGPDGAVRTLAERRFGPELSDALRFRAYWLSPALRLAAGAMERIGSGSAWSAPRARIDVSRGVWIAAGLLSLASALATVFLARRRRLRARETAGWALAALALGLPMFGAFWLIRKGPRLTA